MNPTLVKRIHGVEAILPFVEFVVNDANRFDKGFLNVAETIQNLLNEAVLCETHREFFPRIGQVYQHVCDLDGDSEREFQGAKDESWKKECLEEMRNNLHPIVTFVKKLWEEREPEVRNDPQLALPFQEAS